MHYKRMRKHGDPLYTPPTPEQTFWGSIDRSDPAACWLWDRAIIHDGYGHHTWHGKVVRAHRLALELVGRPCPPGMQVDHTCRQRACINPSHLEFVTAAENMRRANQHSGRGQYRSHCPHGHPYDEKNTYVAPSGSRSCKACKRKRTQEWRNGRRESSGHGADARGN